MSERLLCDDVEVGQIVRGQNTGSYYRVDAIEWPLLRVTMTWSSPTARGGVGDMTVQDAGNFRRPTEEDEFS